MLLGCKSYAIRIHHNPTNRQEKETQGNVIRKIRIIRGHKRRAPRIKESNLHHSCVHPKALFLVIALPEFW